VSNLKETINADLKTAMIARDTVRTQTLQGLKAAILNEEVAKKVRDEGLDDGSIEQIIAREVKKRDEAANLYDQGGNAESAAKERTEKEILAVYLPKQLSESELSELVATVVETMQPEGMKDMGKVIGAVKAQVGNAGDGALIAKLVKEKLQ
jgi:uncharacterized protein YqeY